MHGNIKKRIELLEEYIRNASERKTSNSISSEALYSYRHANRLFKSLKGESIQSYSKKIRLGIGAEYLKYSSKSVFDIAIECGYESTAAFSKAFKAIYGASPISFRENNNFIDLLKNKIPQYSTIVLDEQTIQTFKIKMRSDIDFEGYFQKTKNALQSLKMNLHEWMLLWDEDPKLTQVSESIFQIGFTAVENNNGNFKSTKLSGRYIVFKAEAFKDFPYEIWHELAYTVLEMEDFNIREAPYIEFFKNTSLLNSHSFFPYKIAIPIQ